MKKVVIIVLLSFLIIFLAGFAISRGYVYYKIRVVDKMDENYYNYANILPEDKVIENNKNWSKEKSFEIGNICFENVFGDIEKEFESKDGVEAVKFKNGIVMVYNDENIEDNTEIRENIEILEKKYKNFQMPKYEAYKELFNTCPDDLTVFSSTYYAYNFVDILNSKEVLLRFSPIQDGESYYCIQSANYKGFQTGSFNIPDEKMSIITLLLFKSDKHISLSVVNKNGQVNQEKIDKVLSTIYFKE